MYTSTRFIPDRFLPDKAIDLIDEAGARVKLRQTTLPSRSRRDPEAHQVHRASDGERDRQPRVREGAVLLRRRAQGAREPAPDAREVQPGRTSTGVVTKDDIEDVVARWTGVPMTAIREEEVAKLLRIEEELHTARHQPGEGDLGAGAGNSHGRARV